MSVSDAVTRVETARKQVMNKKVIVDKLGGLRKVISVVQSVGDSLKDLHPALGATAKALDVLMGVLNGQAECRDEALDLVVQLDSFLVVQDYMPQLQERKRTRSAVEAMLAQIKKASDYICQQTTTGYMGNLFGAEYKKKLEELGIEFSRAKETFDRSLLVDVSQTVHDLEEEGQFRFIHEMLDVCEGAQFKTGEGYTCLEGTRTELRLRIMNWVGDSTDGCPSLFWLRGMAGSGKTTVANTIAEAVDTSGHLLSCFFCKRDDAARSRPERLLPTLSWRFAQQHEPYRTILSKVLRTRAGVAYANVTTQFEELFKRILPDIAIPSGKQYHVVVVDALNECGSSREQRQLAKALLALSRATRWIKILVTSQDAFGIGDVFEQSTDCTAYDLSEERGVDDDIRHYILDWTDKVYSERQLRITLSDEDVGQLVIRAQGLFIWCNTLFKYVEPRLDPRMALQPYLSHAEKSESWGQLYQLYDQILHDAWGNQEDASVMRTVLGIVKAAADNRPLSAKAIAIFLPGREDQQEWNEGHVLNIVGKLRAVLYIDHSMNAAIRAYHASFYEYIRERTSTLSSGWERTEAIHRHMLRKCVQVLGSELRFNICDIETPVFNKNIPDLARRISNHMSEALQYSSLFWFTHLPSEGPSTRSETAADNIAEKILELLSSIRLLFWLETLSLQGSVRQSLLACDKCVTVFKVSVIL
ncbi:hypothetical protein EIP86_007419 [Pleurotus ostreatoroseus]|nr:hypothetical protein EIP86_007419 [Pleurotus ostreatoroseus]